MFSLFLRRALARRPALNALTTLVGRQPTLSSSSTTLPALVVTTRPRFFSLSAPLSFPVTEKKTTKKPTTTAGRKKRTEKPAAKKKKTASTASKSKAKTKKPAAKKKPARKKTVVAKPKKKKAPKKVVLQVQTPRNTRQSPILRTLYHLLLILRGRNSPPSSSSASNASVWRLLSTHVSYSQSQAHQCQGSIPNRSEDVGSP